MNKSEYGDFEEIKDESEKKPEEPDPTFNVRARIPRQGQLIGVVLERLGGKRMSIKATDKKVRNCRVPGRFRRKFWLRPNHIVIIEPWPDDDNKGDIVYQYRPAEIAQLRKRGILDDLSREF
ncbi:MAG: translation initiation factor IF-1A [Nanoarchaeota archaeon]|nr:translation initiation factor IF-1A [Nanoarchaeota archaeon]MBU1050934.1 translation initiation factor IF-1A [Nanoarchaeota archaeon]MBU1988469.1 translation initiation factor IF-1A [Nanoarchaeota archaeon]